jgi:hypothetical protein
VNEVNQELLAMKEAYEQLDREKQVLANELEKRSFERDQNETKQTIGILLLFCLENEDIHFLF